MVQAFVCKFCLEQFHANKRWTSQDFCSLKCWYAFRKREHIHSMKHIKYVCKFCRNSFQPVRKRYSTFCSPICYFASRKYRLADSVEKSERQRLKINYQPDSPEEIAQKQKIAETTDRRREYLNRWYKENKDRLKTKARDRYEQNREQYKERTLKWHRANPKKCRESTSRWVSRNRDRVNRVAREYHRKNPDALRLRNQRRRARRLLVGGNVTQIEWTEIKKIFKFLCAYCRRKRKLTMDHIVALAIGGQHLANNIVPACKPCNSSKGIKSLPGNSRGLQLRLLDRL